MKARRSKLIDIIGVIIVVILIIIGVNEANGYANKIDWQPLEVYPMANQNIDWL